MCSRLQKNGYCLTRLPRMLMRVTAPESSSVIQRGCSWIIFSSSKAWGKRGRLLALLKGEGGGLHWFALNHQRRLPSALLQVAACKPAETCMQQSRFIAGQTMQAACQPTDRCWLAHSSQSDDHYRVCVPDICCMVDDSLSVDMYALVICSNAKIALQR